MEPLDHDVFQRMAKAPPEVRDLARIWPLGFMFQLPENANIVVAGAYRGAVMELLATIYPDYSRLIGFEPQKVHRDFAQERLTKGNPQPHRVLVNGYGIGVENAVLPMAEYGAEFSGFVATDPRRPDLTEHGVGEIREFNEVMERLDIHKIHLLLLNMEGYEFYLVPHLLKTGWFENGAISHLAIQIHWGMPNDGVYSEMVADIRKTHKLVYDAIPNWAWFQWSGVEWD